MKMKNNIYKEGLTLLELLVSLAIIVIIIGASVPVYHRFYIKNELDDTVNNTIQKIRRAQSLAWAAERDDHWGVAIKEGKIILFKGDNYENHDTELSEVFSFSEKIISSGLEEIVFEKLSGTPMTTGVIEFYLKGRNSRIITINEMGVLSYIYGENETEEPSGSFCGGDGTLEDPYLICNAHQLNRIREDISLHYRISNNINLDINPFNDGEGWSPIGEPENSFIGTLDGGGYLIFGLYINRPEENYNGLFGHITATPGKKAGVYWLGLVEPSVTGGDYTGGITGYIGGVWNANGEIKDSYVKGGEINGKGSTGGVAGYTAYKSYLGNVYSISNINGGWGTGGISGSHWGANNVIINSYSASQIISSGGAGGIIGQGNSSVINSYWNLDIFPTSPRGVGKTTEEMKNINTFSLWNIYLNNINLNDGYPYLCWENSRVNCDWLIYE